MADFPSGRAARGSYELAAYKTMRDKTGLTEFMQKRRISWYILQPGSEVACPTSFLEKAVFHCGGYSVFHFSP